MDTVKQKIKKGFTLMEVLIVVAIFSLAFAFISNPIMSFYRQIVFQGATENVMTMLDEARKSTLSSYNSDRYGVHFETSKIVLFKGSNYVDDPSSYDTYELKNSITISTISLNDGPSVVDVVFDRLTGETSQYGYIEMDSTLDNLSARRIDIYASGLVELN